MGIVGISTNQQRKQRKQRNKQPGYIDENSQPTQLSMLQLYYRIYFFILFFDSYRENTFFSVDSFVQLLSCNSN